MIPLDPATRKKLRQLRQQCRDTTLYAKLSTILMLDAQYTPAQIEECLGVDITTIHRYVKDFQQMDLTDFLLSNQVDYAGQRRDKEETNQAAGQWISAHQRLFREGVVAFLQEISRGMGALATRLAIKFREVAATSFL
jgi:hypothetical protein